MRPGRSDGLKGTAYTMMEPGQVDTGMAVGEQWAAPRRRGAVWVFAPDVEGEGDATAR